MQLELVVVVKVFRYSMCSNCEDFDFKKITFMDIIEERFDGHYEEIPKREDGDDLQFIVKCNKCNRQIRLGDDERSIT